ncbi:MAG: efflux RND transporter permease subunit, partial [Acidobacteriota bacterium]|nr:efflux RND transporter permease subunit [Acidobacteriota bacterium]
MLNGVILWSLRNRLVVLALAALLLGFGVEQAMHIPLDVFPDFAPPQVVIQTESPGFSATEVEQLVSLPIETTLNGTSELETLRSSSIAGLSVVTCIFAAGTDIFRARQLVTEKLQLARARLPQGANDPHMAPISSPIGTLFKISLTSRTTSPMDLRTLADWTIRRRLLAVPGVSQVTIMGGEVKQYQVIVDPAKLKNYDLTLAQVMTAAGQSNQNAGGGFLNTPSQSLVIQGEGRVRSLGDLANAVIAVKNGVPVRIGQVAAVQFGAEYKVGDSSAFGRPCVYFMVLKQPWANTLETTKAVETALGELRRAIPADVTLDETVFRQADFIERSISNIDWAMLQGGALVLLVLIVFLFSWRTGLISLLAIPLSLLTAVLVLRQLGGTLNVMTLGGLAIAIGEVVDDAIVDVENIYRRLRENRLSRNPAPALGIIYHASSEVRTSVVYATVIVALVFLPIFSLSGLAGRIFAPLAIAYIIAILASLVVALTVTPALSYLLLPRAIAQTTARARETWTVRRLKSSYGRILPGILNHAGSVISVSAILLIAALAAVPFLGGEFLPEFNEGNLIVHMAGVPGTSLEESMRVGAVVQRRLMRVPEVVKIAQRTGRAELGEDTWGPHYTEIDVNLKESGRTRDAVMADVRKNLEGLTGYAFSIKQFISERIEEVLSGTTATIVVKLFGPDLDVLQEKAAEIQSAMAAAPGLADLAIERQSGVPQLLIRFNRQAMSRYGLNSADLAASIRTAFFGSVVSEVYEQQKSFALLVRFDPALTRNPQSMRETLIDSPIGAKVPLGAVAHLEIVGAPATINREGAQRRIVISANTTGAGSLTSIAQNVQHRIGEKVHLPTGYYVVYGGQYEAQSQALRQILILSLAAIVGIFLLLYLAFRSLRESLLVMANLPLALIGGIVAVLLASGGETSIASLVGFVSLFGIATRNGIMLITHYHHLMREEGMSFGRDLVERGALERLSPILM